MTRSWVVRCDRCAKYVELREEVVEDDDVLIRTDRPEGEGDVLQGWTQNLDGSDVCPSCMTLGERADQLFAEAEASVIFGGEE